MSSTRSTANPETGDVSVNTSRPSSSFFQKPLAVSANFAEQGLQVFNQEQGTSVSAPGATRTVRKDGGIPSSPAFAAEQAKDAHRFAALNLETCDQSVSLRYDPCPPGRLLTPFTLRNSSQMKRDFLLTQAAPSVPPGFATGPSNANHPISRSASMAGEVVDSPTEVTADDEDATPLILANHKEVSKLLHLAGPPTQKAGQKQKAETALAAAARANGNITRLSGKIIALEARSRFRNVNLGKLDDKIDVVGVESCNGIENLEARINLLATGASSDARVSLHTSQIAQLTDSLDTIKRTLERLTTAFLCTEDGVPVKHFATKGDIGGLWDSVQESFDGLDQLVDERMAPTIQKAGGAADLVAKLDAQVAKLETHDAKREHDLLAARENIARLQIDLAAALTGSTLSTSAGITPSVPAATAAPPTVEARPTFSVGGKRLKRKASVELIAGPVKRANRKPDKSTFHHWICVSPVNPDTKNAPPLLFRKLVDAAAIKDYSLPAVYIERATGEPSVLNVGFTSASDANSFVGAWSGATFLMPAGLHGITAQHMVVAGSSLSNDAISFVTGN
ncbi:hypothetical protein B0H14DRAFT_3491825 [Mycena olivaceomarginata]|nr:hypothetical protein B0H14DRAFT_3491825 [Mycena olivaceomarginata]